METRITSVWTQIALIVLLVLALRLPFLNEAIQGDDIDYLYGAEHAQIEPLHPYHTRYVFLGDMVEMRGHPHPPLNVWFLAGLLAIFGDVREVPFHASYILFSLIAAVSALYLARRFSPHPLLATVLFLVTPAFVVNGTSLESDLPFIAFWLAAAALFVYAVDRKSLLALGLACLAMALAALTAYQAVALVPILFLYAWKRARRVFYLALLTPVFVIALFQIFERISAGSLPASVLAGYMQTYGFQAGEQKLKSAVALTGHLGWIVFPILTFAAFGRRVAILAVVALLAAAYDHNPIFWISIAAGAAVLIWSVEHWRDFLAQWILIFFAGAVVIFFAGSARYLLPLAVPVAILVTKQLSSKWLYVGIALELVLSLALAVVNYKQWGAYRDYAHSLTQTAQTKRVWVDGEWGLRYYLESEGALPLQRTQVIRPGDVVVSSQLQSFKFNTGGGTLAPLSEIGVTSRIPLRIVALNSHSAYSSAGIGLRPFDISNGPIDFVRADIVVERKPTLEYLPMNAPESAQQIIGGVYDLEQNKWRWTSANAVLLLKSPAQATPIKVDLYIPDQSPARTIRLLVNDRPLSEVHYDRPGSYTITTDAVSPEGSSATLTIAVDKTFSVPGDPRQLGIILTEAGFEK